MAPWANSDYPGRSAVEHVSAFIHVFGQSYSSGQMKHWMKYGIDAWRTNFDSRTLPAIPIACMCATAAFYCSKMAFCLLNVLTLRVSSASILHRPVGLLGFTASSYIAAQTFQQVFNNYQQFHARSSPFQVVLQKKAIDWRLLLQSPRDHLRSVLHFPKYHFADNGLFICCGALIYFMSGGRLKHFVPANLFWPGPFSRLSHSLPAVLNEYASNTQKAQLNAFARKLGCHHCGKRYFFRRIFIKNIQYIGDHMPPNKFVLEYGRLKGSQRLFPQCPPCSQKQAIAVRDDSTTLILPKTFRAHDFYWPLPVLVAALIPLTRYLTDEEENEYEKRQRQRRDYW